MKLLNRNHKPTLIFGNQKYDVSFKSNPNQLGVSPSLELLRSSWADVCQAPLGQGRQNRGWHAAIAADRRGRVRLRRTGLRIHRVPVNYQRTPLSSSHKFFRLCGRMLRLSQCAFRSQSQTAVRRRQVAPGVEIGRAKVGTIEAFERAHSQNPHITNSIKIE